MSTYDDFIHISTGEPKVSSWPGSSVSREFFDNSKGLRVFTEGVIVDAIVKNHPNHHLTIPVGQPAFLAFAHSSDEASVTPTPDQSIIERYYLPPARRTDDNKHINVAQIPVFAVYNYTFKGTAFLLYIVHSIDFYPLDNYFLLTPLENGSGASVALAQAKADELVNAITNWQEDLHGEVLVFDQGFWSKNKDLFDNIQKANWEDVILDKERKDTIINDVLGFFNSGKRYAEYGVPWKVSSVILLEKSPFG